MLDKIRQFVRGYIIGTVIYEVALIIFAIAAGMINCLKGGSFRNGVFVMSKKYVSFAHKIFEKISEFFQMILDRA